MHYSITAHPPSFWLSTLEFIKFRYFRISDIIRTGEGRCRSRPDFFSHKIENFYLDIEIVRQLFSRLLQLQLVLSFPSQECLSVDHLGSQELKILVDENYIATNHHVPSFGAKLMT